MSRAERRKGAGKEPLCTQSEELLSQRCFPEASHIEGHTTAAGRQCCRDGLRAERSANCNGF